MGVLGNTQRHILNGGSSLVLLIATITTHHTMQCVTMFVKGFQGWVQKELAVGMCYKKSEVSS